MKRRPGLREAIDSIKAAFVLHREPVFAFDPTKRGLGHGLPHLRISSARCQILVDLGWRQVDVMPGTSWFNASPALKRKGGICWLLLPRNVWPRRRGDPGSIHRPRGVTQLPKAAFGWPGKPAPRAQGS